MERKLSIYVSETDHVIAYSLDDANAVLSEQYGLSVAEIMSSDMACTREHPADKPITITDAETRDLKKTTKTPAEWIASEGRGLLCTTEY